MPTVTARSALALICRMAGSSRPRHRVFALCVLPILLALVPLAHASPPDSTWLAGLYDNGDFDDVIVAVVSASAVVTNIVVIATEAARSTAGVVWTQPQVVGIAADCFSFTIRPPPSTARLASA